MNQDDQNTLIVQSVLATIAAAEIPLRWKTSKLVNYPGQRKSRRRGHNGFDIEATTEFEDGDDPRNINWAATAQSGGTQIYVRRLKMDVTADVYILVNVGSSMEVGSCRVTKKILAAELTGSIAESCRISGDKIGVVLYDSGGVVQLIKPSNSASIAYNVVANIVESSDGQTGPPSSLKAALEALPQRKSLVFIVSDFLELNRDDELLLTEMGVQHDVVCVVVHDLRERELPAGPGVITLADIVTGQRKVVSLNKKNRIRFTANFLHWQNKLRESLQLAHCEAVAFSTEEGETAIERLLDMFRLHR